MLRTERESQRSAEGHPWVFSREMTSTGLRKLPKAKGTNLSERIGEQHLALAPSWEQCLFPPAGLEKLIIHRTLSGTLRKALPQ